jgi:hypothetical protein
MIQTSLPANDRTTILDLISQLETILTGKLTALTEEERVRFGSINEQNKLLVNKVLEYRQNQPLLSSPDVDWNEFDADYETRSFLEGCSDRLKSLVYRMQSTKILHDHDNYQDALSDYAYSQYKKGTGEPGFAEKVAEIKQFFNRTGSSAPPAPPDNPPDNG